MLTDKEWEHHLYYVEKGKCTPFLGAGAASGALPLAENIALEWAKEYEYPLNDSGNLRRVAQYMAVIDEDFVWLKDRLADRLKKCPPPDFDQPDEVHSVLAALPLPIYITTNYDDSMAIALERRQRKPVRMIFSWTKDLQRELTPTPLDQGYEPSAQEPLVFHLHGHVDRPKSMVLTEDDYVDFLVHITEHFQEAIPRRIQQAFSDSIIFFLGYGLADWDFRILFRALSENVAKSQKRAPQVSVQLLPGAGALSNGEKQKLQTYLDKYYKHLEIKVLWGSCHDFMGELRRQWEARRGR